MAVTTQRDTVAHALGDFFTTPRLIPISLAAIGIGAISAVVAFVLLRLIGLFSNLFFFQRWSTALVSPAGNQLGLLVVAVPVIGALIIGLMARYGSERIRVHGLPEPIKAILINGSRVDPKVAVLTVAVYTSEDLFSRLPIHWMWWPAMGGLIIGLGGHCLSRRAAAGGGVSHGADRQGALGSD